MIQERFLTPAEMRGVEKWYQGRYKRRLYKAIQLALPLTWRKYYWQRFLGYDPAVLKLGNDVYLDGYWQSWKFFDNIQEVIRSEFTLKETLSKESRILENQIKNMTAVGVHVRRGDYVSNPITSHYHGTCGVDYYRQAVSKITERANSPHFFIFSDDPEWAKNNLSFMDRLTIVKRNGDQKDYEDLYLLSLCQYFILANSSFSWWAAWLSSKPHQNVIAPRQWFAAENMNMDDLLLEGWQRI
jgi:hypothetical protein